MLVVSHSSQLSTVSLEMNQIRKITPQSWANSYIKILVRPEGVKETVINLNKNRMVCNKSPWA